MNLTNNSKKVVDEEKNNKISSKSQYNTGSPISLDELSEEERRIAIHEWAEGSRSLEQLLNESYENGLISNACCGGGGGEHSKQPYIEFNLTDEHSQKIAMHLAQQLQQSNLDCSFSFLSNLSYTREEMEALQSIGAVSVVGLTNLNVRSLNENREEVFTNMRDSIKTVDLENIKLPTNEEDIPSQDFKPRETEINTQEQEQQTHENIKENEFIQELKGKIYTQTQVVDNYVDQIHQQEQQSQQIQQTNVLADAGPVL